MNEQQGVTGFVLSLGASYGIETPEKGNVEVRCYCIEGDCTSSTRSSALDRALRLLP